MKKQLIIALKFLLIMTVLTGIVYPVFMTAIAQLGFQSKANGSLITKNGKIVGSGLLGQKFDSSTYFWSRPSATGYNPVPSGASNMGPSSDTLRKLVDSRCELFARLNSLPVAESVPIEMVFASGSGLDPHISPESAFMQVDRIARERHFTSYQKESLIVDIKLLTESPQLLCLGEKRVNVLKLNLQLDALEIKADNLGNELTNK